MVNRDCKEVFSSVYGPVCSWRYGTSLGIDPIGQISTCSFNCVYCQLGEIENLTRDRRLWIPTHQILADLQTFAPWEVDIITLSGSGEPTLALNLGEILQEIKRLTHKPTLVLTNATLLYDSQVRRELAWADNVSVKLDGISESLFRGINRPEDGITLKQTMEGIKAFKKEFLGKLSLQTMVLSPWSSAMMERYLTFIHALHPDEIQLNTPTRPKPLKRELAGRGNHTLADPIAYPVQVLKSVSRERLRSLADEITQATQVLVRYAPSHSMA
ncbi:MAG: radical SAM protein [Snowella sp.]|nr:radical SAM protein [Snowella sp.]